MRKFDKIRENILMVHAKDSKIVEREPTDYPGPASYNPSYNLLEDSGFKVKNIYCIFTLL